MTTYQRRRHGNIIFECRHELDIRLSMWESRSNRDYSLHFKRLANNLCVQTMPFIALGGISNILSGVPSTTCTANIMDALLDGFLGVSNHDMPWKALSDYCEAEGTPLVLYEAVLDWIPNEIINYVFDYICFAIEGLEKTLVRPVTLGRHYEVAGICMIDEPTLRIKATLELPD